jgi:hypothetical protein
VWGRHVRGNGQKIYPEMTKRIKIYPEMTDLTVKSALKSMIAGPELKRKGKEIRNVFPQEI